MSSRDPVLDRVGEVARMRMHGMSWAGISIGLTTRDETLGVVTEGFADLDAHEPVRPDHLFQLGSIGKSFTAIALLQLQEEGRLDLQAPVTDYLPWFEVKGAPPITIHHLLTHTSGLITGMEISTDGAFDVWWLREEEVGFAPGTDYSYSNMGYRTLGLVLEAITGSSYAEEIGTRILGPLEMHATAPAITNEIRARTARGYTQLGDDRVHRRDSPLAPARWLVNATGDGCISSTPEDMTAYLRMLMNGGRGRHGPILSEESFALLTQQAAERDDRWYGYGVQTWESDGRRHVGHGGGMVGFFSDMRADLDTGVGAIVLVNAPDFEVTEEIAGDALASLRAAVQGDALPDVRPSGDRLRVPHADQLTGTYRGAERELVVQTEGDHVWIQDGEDRAELEPLERDQFVPRHDRLDRFRV